MRKFLSDRLLSLPTGSSVELSPVHELETSFDDKKPFVCGRLRELQLKLQQTAQAQHLPSLF